MSNNAVATTGPRAFVIGSTLLFQAAPTLGGLPWNLAGGLGTLWLTDPTGALNPAPGIAITIVGYTVTAPWAVTGPEGMWLRSWDLTDASGVRQLSAPVAFEVTSKSG